jgi:hypothetical protein
VIRADRLAAYGPMFTVRSQPPQPITVGTLPGLAYGLTGVDATGTIQEQSVGYMTFDGAQYLYIIVTRFDPAAVTGKFERLTDFEAFLPYYQVLVENLNLPNSDW